MSFLTDDQTGQPNWPIIIGIVAGGVLLWVAVKGRGGTGSVANAGTSLNAATGQLEYQGLQTQGMLTDVQNSMRSLNDQQAQQRTLINQLGASLGTYTGSILDAFGPLYGTTGVQPVGVYSPPPGGYHDTGALPGGGSAQYAIERRGAHGTFYDSAGTLVTFSGPELSAGELYRRMLGPTPSGHGQLITQGPYPTISAVGSLG
jgi:hypothetical protein